MAHLIENMIYRGETPWHKLGIKFDGKLSVKEALDLAKLSNWDLKLRQLYYQNLTATGQTELVPVDRAAVIRSTDGAIVGDAVGLKFKPIQIEEAFSIFEPYVAAGCDIETAGSINDGRRVWMLARLNRPDSVIVPESDDRVAKYLLCAMGHDGSLSFRIGMTPIRVVCNNTLQMALGKKGAQHVKVKHTVNASGNIEAIKEEIEKIDANFEKSAEIFRALSKINIKNDAQIKAYVKAVFSQKDEDEEIQQAPIVETGESLFSGLLSKPATGSQIASPFSPEGGQIVTERKSRVLDDIMRLFHSGAGADMPGVKGTAWGLYNAVTNYNSHERGRDEETRFNANNLQPQGPVLTALPTAIDQFLNKAA